MLKYLQKKWNISGWRLLLVLITFAVGGSLTGLAGKKLMELLQIKSLWVYAPLYVVIVTIIWPLAVLAVSIPLGQFTFFISYLKKFFRTDKLFKRSGKRSV